MADQISPDRLGSPIGNIQPFYPIQSHLHNDVGDVDVQLVSPYIPPSSQTKCL
jgi:hypothetical protein